MSIQGIVDDLFNATSGQDAKGSSLKWLQALEEQSFKDFNKFDSQQNTKSNQDGLETDTTVENGSVGTENDEAESPLPFDTNELAVLASLADSRMQMLPGHAVHNQPKMSVKPANVNILSIQLNTNQLKSSNKLQSAQPLQQALAKADVANEFLKVIETHSGVTVLMRNYFKTDSEDLKQWASSIKKLVEDQIGVTPKMLLNGNQIDFMEESNNGR